MAFPPNLFLIGAQKAGTTFLANLLGQHEEICVSEPKEPAYLTRNFEKGLDWYRSKFSDPDATFLLDATTGYTSSPLPETDKVVSNSRFWGVPGRLKDLSPEALLIYIARDPVARTYSAYWHNVRAGLESRPFRDAIREDSYYLRTSRYFDQLELYRNHFPVDRMHILKFEDLTRDPVDVLNRCFSFLHLAVPANLDTNRGKNRSFIYPTGLSQLNRALSKVGGLGRITKSLQPYMPPRIKDWLYTGVAKPIPKISPQDVEYLTEYFDECNRNFSEEYDVDIRGWRQVPR